MVQVCSTGMYVNGLVHGKIHNLQETLFYSKQKIRRFNMFAEKTQMIFYGKSSNVMGHGFDSNQFSEKVWASAKPTGVGFNGIFIIYTYRIQYTQDGLWIFQRMNNFWLVVWNICVHILGIVAPTDELIFFRGVGIAPTRFGFIQIFKRMSKVHQPADRSVDGQRHVTSPRIAAFMKCVCVWKYGNYYSNYSNISQLNIFVQHIFRMSSVPQIGV